jgi:hypothetical protein
MKRGPKRKNNINDECFVTCVVSMCYGYSKVRLVDAHEKLLEKTRRFFIIYTQSVLAGQIRGPGE